MEKLTKSYAFKAEIAENVIRGGPAVMGNLDRGGDVIFPGAFQRALKSFRENGFVAFGHDWERLPVAMPTKIEERGNILWGEAIFHSTPDAQAVRTVAQERLEHGLSVGLSIGFSAGTESFQYFESGGELLRFARDNHIDISLFDERGIQQCRGPCRAITRVDELYEWSIVPVPMNPLAVASEVKGATGSLTLPLADRDRPWDSRAAVLRVREWADAEEEPNARYRRAFFWFDAEAPENFGSYKLPFADVIDGTLTAIPRGIFAVAAVLSGARGGVDIPESDVDAVKRRVSRYYARMRDEFDDDSLRPPWEGGKQLLPADAITTPREFERFLREAGFSKTMATAITSRGFVVLRQRESEEWQSTQSGAQDALRKRLSALRNRLTQIGVMEDG